MSLATLKYQMLEAFCLLGCKSPILAFFPLSFFIYFIIFSHWRNKYAERKCCDSVISLQSWNEQHKTETHVQTLAINSYRKCDWRSKQDLRFVFVQKLFIPHLCVSVPAQSKNCDLMLWRHLFLDLLLLLSQVLISFPAQKLTCLYEINTNMDKKKNKVLWKLNLFLNHSQLLGGQYQPSHKTYHRFSLLDTLTSYLHLKLPHKQKDNDIL